MPNLNTLCLVLEDQSGSTDYDIKAPDYKVLATVWVELMPQRAKEQIEGQQRTDDVLYTAMARLDPVLQVGRRLRHGNVMWEINTLIDVNNRHEYYKMMLTVV